MRNNFRTNQFNRTKLTRCSLQRIQHNLAKLKFKNWERGTGEDHKAGQILGIVNMRYLRNGQTHIHQIYRKFLAHTPAKNGKKTFSQF